MRQKGNDGHQGTSAEVPRHRRAEDEGVRRRDFLNVAAVSFAGVGAVAAIAPLIVQMSPSADVLALATTEVDISKIQPGQGIKTSWRKQPVFVRNLTPKEIAEANAVPLSDLRDPQTLAERTKPGKANWLITLGVCTHLGCVPLGIGEGENQGPFGGYFCPCHGSMYDTAARIRQGPAPKNLEVPDYKFTVADDRPDRREGVERQMSFSWAKPYEPKHPLMRWIDERLPLPRLVYGAIGGGYPVPRNLNYWWNFGVLAGIFLTIQIVTGIVLAMHYYAIDRRRVQLGQPADHARRQRGLAAALRAHERRELLLHRHLHPHLPRAFITVRTRRRASWCGCSGSSSTC